ncbi:MAG: S9 family peptidase [Actinobacteria bacterium]|nr:S9 family peptidase [Actinomycetota bacterium]
MNGMVPEDVFELTGVADPRLSPDGKTVAYVVAAVDAKANDYRGAIWLAPADGAAEPRRFTSGAKHDAGPRWSPDGAQLAFTSNREGKAAQLYVMPLAGGEPRKLTSLKEDVTQLAWSPDGATIAFVARVPDAAYDEEDEKRRQPRRFTRLQYKLDSVGWTGDRRQHLFAVGADGAAAPVQLTDGDYEDSAPAWSPDGATLAFVSGREPDWDIEPVSDVYLVAAEGGEPRRLTHGGGSIDGIAWSADGARLAAQRYPGVFDDPKHTQIAIVDAQTGDVGLLTTALDRNCGTYPQLREPLWDGGDLVFAVEDHGNTHLYRVAADGSGAPRLAVGGELTVTGFDAAAGRLVYSADEPMRLSELFAAERRLTHVGDAFAAGRELAAAERFTATSADGSAVDAWIMKPVGYEPGQTYPTLLNIHGGPYGQYGNAFFDEFQVYCAAGYVVVFSNPRGSSGSGEAWARAIRGPGAAGPGWGSVDFDDCMAVIEEAVRRYEFVDGERLGVIGGSYGGYMTSWIVSHSDRFKAAVSERAVNQLVSEWGSSDIGWDFKGYLGTFVYEDVEPYLSISPATYAERIHTPLLILHSEKDLRCAVEQAEHLFVTLRLLKRTVELVRFPEESHELTRSGSPAHRVQRFHIVLDWFDRYLKG